MNELDYFIENLSMLIGSGMNIVDALESIKTELRSRELRKAIDFLKQEIGNGSPMWRAIEKANFMPNHIVGLIRIGEESGRLVENLQVIAMQQQKERELNSRVRSAMLYPLIVFSLTVVIGVGVAWFILPKLATVFSGLKLKLPLITRLLIAFGMVLGKHGLVIVPLTLVTIAMTIYIVFFYPKTKIAGQRLLFNLPIIKQLIQQVEIARFGFVLGTLLKAGLPVIASLNSLQQATTFPLYQQFYYHVRLGTEQGNSFQRSFSTFAQTERLIPRPIQGMIIAAEQSGSLADSLLKIGASFETKTETTTKNLTVVLEPILLVIVWVGVVGVSLAVILPIYSLIGGLNK
ncbi:type II secretion system F family protein [Candidatus Berkelbacteria bacterium]|nr:type II secretion system F family protein [Candidatus Berkelbacteria bacterium]